MSAEPQACQACVAVAFSGGRDSLALLHATCRAAAILGLQVVALHVHHGLLPEADDWVLRAQRLCARWRARGWPLRLRWAQLPGAPAQGESVEAWARTGRYVALAQMAQEEGAGLVLLAQHRRDQAETFLLQALRGGGAAGLSAMPAVFDRLGLRWARPWLAQPREAIEAYVSRHRLRPVEDPSNLDDRMARNRMRLQLWPALQAAFSDAETALASAAQRAQEAHAALVELAAMDLATLVDDRGGLLVAGWRQLSSARQANALRAWWLAQAGQGASTALLQRLLGEVPEQGAGRWPAGAGVWCVLHRGRLQHVLPRVQKIGHAASTIDLSQPGRWLVPGWGGYFEVTDCRRDGMAPALLQSLCLRARAGGERFQREPGGLPRSLKKQYQSANVPEHERAGPLLWAAGRLLFAPGLGIDARSRAAVGEPQLALRWCPERMSSASTQIVSELDS